MRTTPEVVVLCNGAAEPGNLSSGQKIQVLDYRGSTSNVAIGLPNFIRGIYHLLDRVLDLLEVAAYIYCADRLTSRGRPDAVEYHSWARSFNFHIKVRDLDFWSTPSVQKRLSKALCFIAGDEAYTFSFEGGHLTDPTGLFDSPEFAVDRKSNTKVALYSGGLDSLAGALELLEEGSEVCLVRHRSLSDTVRTQKQLFNAIRRQEKYKGRAHHYHFKCHLQGPHAIDESQRTRAFLYTSIAYALSSAVAPGEFFVFENGVTSINLRRSEEALNARTSRTTHPKAIRLFEEFFSIVNESPVRINTPYILQTKADIFAKIRSFGQGDLISSSVSCSGSRSKGGQGTHCGTCFQCVDRRLAAYASNSAELDTGIYNKDIVCSPLNGNHKKVVTDYIRQARHFYKWDFRSFYRETLIDLTNLIAYLPSFEEEDEAEMAVFELFQRHGHNVHAALRQICLERFDPYSPAPNNSLLAIVDSREYLKDPAEQIAEEIAVELERTIPPMFAKNRLPKDEPDFNQKVGVILQRLRDDLRSEYPEISIALSTVIPDHSFKYVDLLIESKYVRGSTSPSKASAGIFEDIGEYPDCKFILFVVYDPRQQIRDIAAFRREIEGKRACKVLVLR